jgi:hypothetical protein
MAPPLLPAGLPKSDSPRGLIWGRTFMNGFSVYVDSVDLEWLWPWSCDWLCW